MVLSRSFKRLVREIRVGPCVTYSISMGLKVIILPAIISPNKIFHKRCRRLLMGNIILYIRVHLLMVKYVFSITKINNVTH